jgi:hypothetical protein
MNFSFFRLKWLNLPLLSAVLGQANVTYAEQGYPAFSVKGFGTLAVTGTDTDAIGFRRDITTVHGATKSWSIPTDSRLGLQIEAKFNEDFSATTQWVLRERTGQFFEQNLDMAFLRWNIKPDFYVRFGRVSTDAFMLSDYRNVGYAYPWMRPPHEFYGHIPIYHYDGIDITKKLELDGGYLTMRLFGGYTFNQIPSFVDNKVIEQGGTIFRGSAIYEKGDWKGRLSYSQYDVRSDTSNDNILKEALLNPAFNVIWPDIKSLVPRLKTVGTIARFSALGVSYDDGIWLGQAEASYIDTDSAFFPSMGSGYLSLGRRFSSLTFYTLLGIGKTLDKVNIPKPLIPNARLLPLQQVLNKTLNNDIDEKSISLGLRWDFYTNMAFKAQWSHYWLGNNGTRTWIQDQSATPPDQVNVLSVGIDFVF